MKPLNFSLRPGGLLAVGELVQTTNKKLKLALRTRGRASNSVGRSVGARCPRGDVKSVLEGVTTLRSPFN